MVTVNNSCQTSEALIVVNKIKAMITSLKDSLTFRQLQ